MTRNLTSHVLRAALLLAGLSTMSRAITATELSRKLQAGEVVQLIDLRSQNRYELGTIPGAMNIPAAVIETKKLPPLSAVVLFDDGMAGVDVGAIAASLNQRPGWKVEVLEGGFAAWKALSGAPQTSPAGLRSEDVQHITYEDLAGLKEKVVLLDLRPAAPPASTVKSLAKPGQQPAAAPQKEPVSDFCGKAGNRTYQRGLAEFRKNYKAAGTNPGKSVKSDRSAKSAPPQAVPPLVVLVDTVESDNRETVRRLHAEGYSRILVLAGGDESIQLEGRRGKGRISGTLGQGELKVPPSQPQTDKP
ncbi:rhodanese-like domain-containing protein [Luteolibacter yonseiensis]|uniref:Rhodanese-like domain-containing protein n=1 Tax=Luteolibacter yonseiensis TaxID=1144680 RepID=A0A934R6S4_9BACT|nr:rhodanese-like domain-containing protein [Luteolibacter yonseiensis]MBK1818009.1 rhodanese-like domain-containing protein [Luteolibacter yonseiensis]